MIKSRALIQIFQSLPDFKGKRRLARRLLQEFIAANKNVHIKGKYDINYELPNCVETIGFEILINGIYEKETCDFILKRLRQNAAFLDIGSNIGAISMPLLKLRSDIKVYCIEASPRVFSYLDTNFNNNQLCNYHLFNYAVSDVPDKFFEFYSPVELFGKGSFTPLFTKESEKVKSITIDSFLNKESIPDVDFIKVDVEGYEFKVFKGAKNLLSKSEAPDILFEFVDWAEKNADDLVPGQAQELLMQYGYRLYELSGTRVIELQKPINRGDAMIFASKRHV